jgi:flagellar hook-length control protein FliK
MRRERDEGVLGPAVGHPAPNARPAEAMGDGAASPAEVRPHPAATLPEQVGLGIEAAARGPQTVRLHLQPEGLGSVLLQVARGEQGLSVHLLAESVATRDLLQATAAQLAQTLDHRGLAVAQLSVGLAGQEAGPREGRPDRDAPPRRGRSPTPSAPVEAVAARTASLHRIDYRV